MTVIKLSRKFFQMNLTGGWANTGVAISHKYLFLCAPNKRRGAGVAELARLESVYTARYRGFESLSLRQSR